MKYTLVLLTLAGLLLSGCGQTGPLYLPEKEPAATTTDEAS